MYLSLSVDVTFVGYGAPTGKSTMHLNAACGSVRAVNFIRNMSRTEIQPDGTWSLMVTLLLPCTLTWRWSANNRYEKIRDRQERLPASTSAILSNFSGDNQEGKNDTWCDIWI